MTTPQAWLLSTQRRANWHHQTVTSSEVQKGFAGFWQAVMDMGLKTATLETLELEEYGDIAVEQGRYQLADAEGNVADHGKYMVIWKRDGGDWKLHRDIWNTSTPPA